MYETDSFFSFCYYSDKYSLFFRKKGQFGAWNTGIQGKVTEVTGNQMPMMGAPKAQPKGIKASVFIYEKTNINQVIQIDSSPIYTTINTKQVAFVETDSSGAFIFALPVGSYSLFIKQGNQFYANLFDSNNNIALFTVEEGKLTQVTLQINNRATY